MNVDVQSLIDKLPATWVPWVIVVVLAVFLWLQLSKNRREGIAARHDVITKTMDELQEENARLSSRVGGLEIRTQNLEKVILQQIQFTVEVLACPTPGCPCRQQAKESLAEARKHYGGNDA